MKFFKNKNPDEYSDEIILIAMYFKVATRKIQNNKNKYLNILIVSTYGYGTSNSILQYITDNYKTNFIECISYYNFKNYNLNTIDLIISTVDNLTCIKDIPIIFIKPFLDKDDISLLSNFLTTNKNSKIKLSSLISEIEKYSTITDLYNLTETLMENFQSFLINDLDRNTNTLSNLLPIDNIVILDEPIDLKNILNISTDILLNNNFIDSRHKDKIISSFEKHSNYMLIDENIAIPHSKSDSFIYKTGFSLVKLNKPILIKNKNIYIFLTFCTKNNIDHIDLLVSISNLITNPIQKEKLLKSNSTNEIFDIISVAFQNKY